MARVLVVDDEAAIRETLRSILERQGYEVLEAGDVRGALTQLEREPSPDCALVDLRLPDEEGTAVLDAVQRRGLSTAVVMISGHGTIPSAVAAVRAGAFDFLEKPLDRERLLITLRNAVRHAAMIRRTIESGEAGFLTASPALRAVLREAQKAAASASPILITGETGSGKEVLARWVHAHSPQAGGPFVALNCAALPENLAESELFGHVKGAFTGADSPRKGKFQSADGGVLFLDEIGDLPLPAQAKLLRVLEEGVVEPVGSDRPVPVRVRVFAATHHDLKTQSAEGSFREDLRFRISGFPLHVPPLRERPEDIPLLATAFLEDSRRRQGWPSEDPPATFLAALSGHSWPGNVRELRWAVERAALLAGPGLPGPEHLPADVRSAARPAAGPLEMARSGAEERAIREALDATGGNVTAAGKRLGLSRSRLYEKLAELGLDPAAFRKKR